MIQRMIGLSALAAMLLCLTSGSYAQPDKKPSAEDIAKAKKALQDVQDFIGLWNLEGTQKVGGKTEGWKEQISWGWKFKDGEAWITVSFAEGKGKYFTDGELRFDTEKKKYILTLMPAEKNAEKQVFEGEFARGVLKVERKDAKTGDMHRITMNTLAEGIRFSFKYEKQDGGVGRFLSLYTMLGNKDGESLAGGTKKPECIVSGGAASITVTYKGKTYYVCCSGCRDEFNANPEKYVK